MEKEFNATEANGVSDYSYKFQDGNRELSLERNFAANNTSWNKPRGGGGRDGAFYILVKEGGSRALGFALTDEEMQELFYAYLALRKDYEDAQR